MDDITLDAFENQVLDKNLNNALIVIDVGGGKGRLAKKLLALADSKNIRLNYFLVEPDQSQCEEARKNLKSYFHNANSNNVISNVEIFEGTFEQFLSSDLGMSLKEKCDVVISSGGPINIQVVSMEEAKKSMQGIRGLIAPEGVVIAQGKSDLLLKRKDLENNYGFNVIASARREIEEDDPYEDEQDNVYLTQCYIFKPKK